MIRLAAAARAAVALAAALVSTAAVARVVDYGPDDAALLALAAKVAIAPVAAAPAKGPYDIVLTMDPATDHISQALGHACSAYKVENPMRQIVERIVAGWDADGDPHRASSGSPRLALAITRGRSDRRCVQLSEFKGSCYVHAQLSGEAVLTAADGAERRFPVSGDVERTTKLGGFCGDMGGSIGVVSREAIIALLDDSMKKAASAN